MNAFASGTTDINAFHTIIDQMLGNLVNDRIIDLALFIKGSVRSCDQAG